MSVFCVAELRFKPNIMETLSETRDGVLLQGGTVKNCAEETTNGNNVPAKETSTVKKVKSYPVI